MNTCESVMTRNPVVCEPFDTVTAAAQLMKNENVGSIPVVNDVVSRILRGIVTDRDLAMKVLADGCDPSSTKVHEVMTVKVVTCYQDDDLQKVLDLMSEYQLRRIPVVNRDNRILGIIAQADIATQLDQPEKVAGVVRDISQENV